MMILIIKIKNALPVSVIVPILIFFSASFSSAGDWRVSPLKVNLSEAEKTGVFRVYNDAKEDLIVEMKAFEWLQDEKGEDRFLDTADLIFFPRVMTIKPNDKRIIRVGSRLTNLKTEKTYRLFIREVTAKKDRNDMGVSIAVQFAVPIFISPRAPVQSIELTSATYKDGALFFTLANAGNTHALFRSITLEGADRAGTPLFSERLRGWYLLAGISRTYSHTIPSSVCSESGRIKIKAEAEGSDVVKDVLLDSNVCEPHQ